MLVDFKVIIHNHIRNPGIMCIYIYICVRVCVRVTYIQMILTYLPVRIRGTISKLDCWKETNQSRMKSIFNEPQKTWLEHIYAKSLARMVA